MAATLRSGAVRVSGASAVSTAAVTHDGQLPHLLRFAPRDTQMVEYGNLLGLKRRIGAEIATRGNVPLPPDAPGATLTAGQAIERAWWWDLWTQIPVRGIDGNEGVLPAEWERLFGFNLSDVDYMLQVGDPPGSYSVIEGSIDPTVVGERLLARGFSRVLSPLGEASAFYVRSDAVDRAPEEEGRNTLASFNRVVASPGVLIAGPATSLIGGSVRAATGQAPSLADDPEVTQVAITMDDPTLLPGTALLGATLFGHGAVERVAIAAQDLISGPQRSFERVREDAERAQAEPRLMPYSVAGLGYRRGAGLGEHYRLITLLCPDETSAREAGDALVSRVTRYQSCRAGGPLVGRYVDEVLPPVVRSGEAGATVSLLLRPKPVHEAGHRGGAAWSAC